MRLKVIAFYEDHWMPPGTDHAQWDHLCRAYGAELQMVRDWTEATIPVGSRVILIDEAGDDDITPFMLDHLVLVFGRSAQDLITAIPENEWDASFTIKTPNNVSMFGVSAAAIVLDRYHGAR
jgi:hypothetical protein